MKTSPIENAEHSLAFINRLRYREEQSGLSDSEVLRIPRNEIYSRLEKAIGRTPVRKIELANGCILFQKDETANPTETHYDRAYYVLLKTLEEEGIIKPGDILLETSSGSAGISFSWMAKKLGYEPILFMPSYLPRPRIQIAQEFAKVYTSDDRATYMRACADEMLAYMRAHKDEAKKAGKRIWMVNHSQDYRTVDAFSAIAEELLEQVGALPMRTCFIGGVGNGSTILGIGRKLKGINPHTTIIGFEPVKACPVFKRYVYQWGRRAPEFVKRSEIPMTFEMHDMPGTGGFDNINFPFLRTAVDGGILDDICPVHDAAILADCRNRYNAGLPLEHQLGHTSLVARYIAEAMAPFEANRTFITLGYDKADRY